MNIDLTHEFYCTRCGRKGIPICRKANKRRPQGHLKKLYCLYCKTEVNHVECVPGTKYNRDMFFKEYKLGNFTESGERKLSLSDFYTAINKMRLEEEEYS